MRCCDIWKKGILAQSQKVLSSHLFDLQTDKEAKIKNSLKALQAFSLFCCSANSQIFLLSQFQLWKLHIPSHWKKLNYPMGKNLVWLTKAPLEKTKQKTDQTTLSKKEKKNLIDH